MGPERVMSLFEIKQSKHPLTLNVPIVPRTLAKGEEEVTVKGILVLRRCVTKGTIFGTGRRLLLLTR